MYCGRLGVRRLAQLGCRVCSELARDHIAERGTPPHAAHPTLYLCPRTLSAEQRLAYAAVLTTFPALHSTDVAILEEIGEALARIRVTSEAVLTRCLEEWGMDGVQGQREFERWISS